MSTPDKKLALAIARCDHLPNALRDSSHPCHKVACFQPNTPNRHIPEGWYGNLVGSRVLLVASNPSIDLSEGDTGENYPRASWDDNAISEWITRRVDQSWPEVPVTFQRPPFKDFLWRCIDGEYRGAGKSNKPQTTWNNVHKLVTELLGPNANPSENYALTEVVHCKSHDGHGVPEASAACSGKWLGKIMELASNSKIVMLLGSHVRPWARREFRALIDEKFGERVKLGGPDVAIRDTFIFQGRVYVYLPHPTAPEPGGRLVSTRFGEQARRVLSAIAEGRTLVPSTSRDLHRLFRNDE